MYEINCSQTHRHTELHIDKHMDIKEKKIKKTTNVVIDGPSDTIRLYYSLYYYCINYPNGLIVSLYEKKKNDHNKISKIFHQHNFYMAMPIFLLLSKKNKHHFFQLVTLRKSMYNLYIFVHLQNFTTNIFPELLTYI